VKSGYGLSTAAELKMLRAIAEVSREPGIAARLDVVPTFIGAHEFPAEFRNDREGYVRLICEEMIPKVVSGRLAEFCDIFCEKGVFEIEQSRRILNAAKAAGLKPRLHAEEFATIGGAELAAEVGAVSADHLMAISDKGIDAMRKAGTVAVLLPGTTFFLGLARYAPARKLVEGGVSVALATDFNPGSSPTVSMPMAMALACTQMRMTPSEALGAATLNAAFAVDRADLVGSLEPGKQADMVLWDAPSHRHIPYRFGDNLVSAVVKRGRVL
jgi:imidazolonepropionase